MDVYHVLPHVADLREFSMALVALIGLHAHVLSEMILEVTRFAEQSCAVIELALVQLKLFLAVEVLDLVNLVAVVWKLSKRFSGVLRDVIRHEVWDLVSHNLLHFLLVSKNPLGSAGFFRGMSRLM